MTLSKPSCSCRNASLRLVVNMTQVAFFFLVAAPPRFFDVESFIVSPSSPRSPSLCRSHPRSLWRSSRRVTHPCAGESLLCMEQQPSSAEIATSSDHTTTNNPHHLTPELLKLAQAFAAIGDDKLRYKQLLYMANQLPELPSQYKIRANQVPGCLSTVHIHAHAEEPSKTLNDPNTNNSDDEPIIVFQGDSDGLLTKGLVSLLIRGLNGNTASAIQRVQPEFIQTAGIAASLTPGRNNGFLNMLAVMKQQAVQASRQWNEQQQQQNSESATVPNLESGTNGESSAVTTPNDRPMYHAILNELEKLQPIHVQLKDVSARHAGHVAMENGKANGGSSGESHFELEIVAAAFEGLNLVQRHKLIYMLLGNIMPQIHALQISAQTPAEAGK